MSHLASRTPPALSPRPATTEPLLHLGCVTLKQKSCSAVDLPARWLSFRELDTERPALTPLARARLELLKTISHNGSSRCLRNAWLSSSARVDDPERCTSSVAAASRGRADARNDFERAQRPRSKSYDAGPFHLASESDQPSSACRNG